MPSTYREAGEEVRDLAKNLMIKYHQELDEAGVKVDFCFAFGELDEQSEQKAPAIMQNGYRALGVPRKISLKDRVMGRGDCEITLDGDEWPRMSPEEQAALLDHELEHFECVRDKTGGFIFDDIDRPVLKLRIHDRQLGWFDNIANRHGLASTEIKDFRKLFSEGGNTYVPYVSYEGALLEDHHKSLHPPEDPKPPAAIRKLVPKRKTGPEPESELKMTVRVNGGPAREMNSQELTKDIEMNFLQPQPDGDEEMLKNAIATIKAEGRASVALLQSRMRIGFATASRMIDTLVQRGIIRPNAVTHDFEIDGVEEAQ